MSTIVDCPSCSRKLRVPEELLGKKVKCPTCSGTFDAVAAPEPARTPAPSSPIAPPLDPRLELGNEGRVRSGGEDTSPAPPTSSETRPASVPLSEQETMTHLRSQPSAEQTVASW